jgi:hypothetical protein
MISRLEDTMNTVTEANVQKPASPLSVRNFRLLWIGEGISLLGVGVALMPLFGSTAVIAVICLVMGAAAGYQRMMLFTWLQKRIPQELMGRVMSLLFFFRAVCIRNGILLCQRQNGTG